MLNTKWLILASSSFGVIHFIASAVYSIANKNKNIDDAMRNEKSFSPIGLDGFQLVVWRICRISLWGCLGFGYVFVLFEVLFLLHGA